MFAEHAEVSFGTWPSVLFKRNSLQGTIIFWEQNEFRLTNNSQRNVSPSHVAMAIMFRKAVCVTSSVAKNLNSEPDNDAEHRLLTEIRKREKILQVQGRDNGEGQFSSVEFVVTKSH